MLFRFNSLRFFILNLFPLPLAAQLFKLPLRLLWSKSFEEIEFFVEDNALPFAIAEDPSATGSPEVGADGECAGFHKSN